MANLRNGQSPTEQDLQNLSFDPTFETFVTQLAGSPDGSNLYRAKVGSDGSLQTSSGLIPKAYDYVAYTNTSSTVDTYKFYSGGSGGTLVATLTLSYTDTTKGQISSVART